jgi:hypothetical protein
MIARQFVGKQRNLTGESFWARGSFILQLGWMKLWLEIIFANKALKMYVMSR